MSKFSKFIKNPKLFFIDVYKNMMNDSSKAVPKQRVDDFNVMLPIKLLLHTGENKSAVSHLKLWVPYFEESGVDFVIMTRHIIAYNETSKEYPHCNVVYAKEKENVECIINKLPMLQACFYPSNTGNNIHLLFYNKITHVFIGHGDSDKTASAHKFFRVYDENWVAGDAHIDRFRNAGFDCHGLKQIKIGRPNLYNVIKQSQEEWKDRFQGKYKVLYLPTWEGTYKEQDYSSLFIIQQNIKLLKGVDKLDINIKLHPFSGKREKSFLNLENELLDFNYCKVIDKQETVNNCIVESNIFICDISAVVSECLASNAPIFLYIPKGKGIKLSQSNMPYNEYCYTFSTPDELLEKLNKVIAGDDYLKDSREKATEYILNKTTTLNRTFRKQLMRVGE